MMETLLLWDIDGTLLRIGSLGADVLRHAVERATGIRPANDVPMCGKTDPQIAREYLELVHARASEELIASVLGHLAAELHRVDEKVRREGELLPGVEELVAALDQDPRVTQTVVTGNLAATARQKLEAFGLDRYLDLEIGGYGSDHEDRTRLVPIAIGRAKSLRGRVFESARTWVVGDTRADFECAHVAGCRCLLVATGKTGFGDLEKLGADAVLPSLEDSQAVLDLVYAGACDRVNPADARSVEARFQ